MAGSGRWLTRAGSALAAACLFGALLSTTAAIGVAASDGSDPGIEQADTSAPSTAPATTPDTEPPPTAPPATEPPPTKAQPTEPPTPPPTDAPPPSQAPPIAGTGQGLPAVVPFKTHVDFSDGSGDSVRIDLFCTGVTVVSTPLDASSASPAVFSVEGMIDPAATTCTATEVVPAGYSASGSPPGTCSAALAVGECTITNTPARAETSTAQSESVTALGKDPEAPWIKVEKDVKSGSDSSVEFQFTLSGPGGGSVALSANDDPHQFSNLTPNGSYTLSESLPPGWAVDKIQCAPNSDVDEDEDHARATITLGDPDDDSGHPYVSCRFTNKQTTSSGTFTVRKDFSPNSSAKVDVGLLCTSGTPTPSSAEASESSPAVFTVTSFSDGATCTATEDPIPSGYVADANGTCTGSLSASDEVDSDDDDDGDGSGCTIRNRLTSKTFKVKKDFQPNVAGHVSVALVCSGSPTPTVATVDATASEGHAARFTVSGYGDPGASSCTATESEVPAGYSSSGTCTASITAGECTIVNTRNSATFTVGKDFDPDNAAGEVTVGLVCSGSPTPMVSAVDSTASEADPADPADFTVSGFGTDASCTATESSVPAGYSSSGTCTATMAVGECTIVNAENSITFTVNKSFSDHYTGEVTVSLDCKGPPKPTVTDVDTTASEADPAEFTVSGFDDGATCTAKESSIPDGYTGMGTPPGSCQTTLVVGTDASCTIFNVADSVPSLTVEKKVSNGSDATQKFRFTLTDETAGGVVLPEPDLGDLESQTWTLTPNSSYLIAETVPDGWSVKSVNCHNNSAVDEGDTSASIDLAELNPSQRHITCTFTNHEASKTFTVEKEFSDGNEVDEVSVSLECPGANVAEESLPASQGSPAEFTVTGFEDATTTQCTATESDVPSGYTPRFGGECTADLVGQSGGCTIYNDLNEATFTVEKEFSDGNEDSVSVSLECPGARVVEESLSASQGSPAEFTVTGFDDAEPGSCTATETGVPSGYTPRFEGQCTGDIGGEFGGGCTLYNDLNEATFTVEKEFSDGNGVDSVSVSLECPGAKVVEESLSASQGSPAVFTVTGFEDASTTECTATESDVPSGYTPRDGGECTSALDPEGTGDCTIYNDLNEATFTVEKEFSDGNEDSVSVSLECPGAKVVEESLSASQGSPAEFTVTGFDDAEPGSCTATETGVPSGYTPRDGGECTSALDPEGTGGCTIHNDLNEATFTVEKEFSDGNDVDSVSVSLECPGAKVVEESLSASQGSPAEFTVTGFDDASTTECTATESDVPSGYTPRFEGECSGLLDGGGEVEALGGVGGRCTIYNDLNTATFTVSKDFEPDADLTVALTVECVEGDTLVGGGVFNDVSEGDPVEVTASGFTSKADTTCTATETAIPPGYTASDDGTCSAKLEEGSCTIVNTLNSATFVVSKDFTDGNTDSVTMRLVCTDGEVVDDTESASEGSPARFTVEGFTRGGEPPVSCDAIEDAVPGYSGSDGGACSAPLEGEGGAACTITNTPIPVPRETATFTVLKDFSDNSTARVAVRVACTAPATVVNGATTMTETSPGNVTVTGFSSRNGTICTATETVPSGYTAGGVPAGTCSATLTAGACTITNTVNTATFTVSKAFSDGNPAAVSLNVACTSGTVSGGSTSASQGSPATVTAQKFANANTTTCTASETPVPGYTGSGSPAGTCSASLSAGGCSITNTLIPPPPPAPPGPPGTPPPGPTVTPIIPTVTPVSVGGRAAVRGTTSTLRRVRVAGDVVHLEGNAPPGCDPVLRVDDRLVGPVDVARDGRFDVDVQTSDLDPGRHVAVIECTNPTAPLLTKVFWVAAPLSSSNILLVALSSMTVLFGLGWVGIQTLAGTGLGSGSAGAAGKLT